ncbi:MAG: MalY/PatB family protein [Hyphomicrobiales bacterium]
MPFDFDRAIDQRNTHSLKWDAMEIRLGLGHPDMLPMWVADMDFAAPPAVTETLRLMADKGVFGYFGDDRDYKRAVCNWMAKRHQFEVDPDWITTSHGVVAAVGSALHSFTQPGDGIVVFSPVYHAFGSTIRAAGRALIESPLKLVQGRYEMDLEGLATQIDAKTKIIILCSPHNPGGRVWSRQELIGLCKFCETHDLLLISDEIHHDLVFDGHQHWVTANAYPGIADRLITLTAASKTFNLAASMTGNVMISNAQLRETFMTTVKGMGSSSPNRIGIEMVTAAYAHGEDWLEALLPYLQANANRFDEAMARIIPGVRSMKLEATYLAWCDFSETAYSTDEAVDRVQDVARIAINKGPVFGEGGQTWLRFNIACPRSTLDEAIKRLETAFQD